MKSMTNVSAKMIWSFPPPRDHSVHKCVRRPRSSRLGAHITTLCKVPPPPPPSPSISSHLEEPNEGEEVRLHWRKRTNASLMPIYMQVTDEFAVVTQLLPSAWCHPGLTCDSCEWMTLLTLIQTLTVRKKELDRERERERERGKGG